VLVGRFESALVVGHFHFLSDVTPGQKDGNDPPEPSLAALRSAPSVHGMTPVSCQMVGDCSTPRMQVAITITIATQNRAIAKPNPSSETGTDDLCSLNCRVLAIVGMFKSFIRGATPKVSVCGLCQDNRCPGISLKSRQLNR
jgi:hypothetical protein